MANIRLGNLLWKDNTQPNSVSNPVNTKDVNSDSTKAELTAVKNELELVKAELQEIKANQLSGDQKVQLSGSMVLIEEIRGFSVDSGANERFVDRGDSEIQTKMEQSGAVAFVVTLRASVRHSFVVYSSAFLDRNTQSEAINYPFVNVDRARVMFNRRSEIVQMNLVNLSETTQTYDIDIYGLKMPVVDKEKMEYYGATVDDRPPYDRVAVGAVFMAVNTGEVWQSNGSSWVVV